MKKIDLKTLGARRLKLLLREIKFIQVQQLAELLSVDPRTIGYWFSKGLSLKNSRLVARVLGISRNFFTDDEETFSARGEQFYLSNVRSFGKEDNRIIFDGRATLMLTRIIKFNTEQLAQIRNVHVETYEGRVFDLRGSDLAASVEGYKRTLTFKGDIEAGGINAVIEPYRVKSIELVGFENLELLMPDGRLPLMGMRELKKHASNVPGFLRTVKMYSEALHYCARIPDERTFPIFFEILNEIGIQYDLFEHAFDASKKYDNHFALHRNDAIRMYHFSRNFILDNANVTDASNAVTYAIESLPFCSFINRDLRHNATAFLRDIEQQSHVFKNASADMRLAAESARNFMPFVRDPRGFRLT